MDLIKSDFSSYHLRPHGGKLITFVVIDINGLKYFDCMEEEKENNIKGIPEKLIESDSEEEKKPSVPTEEEKKDKR